MLLSLVHIVATVFISLFITFNIADQFPSAPVITKPTKIDSKGIYLTGYTAAWKARRQELVDLVNRTEVNSMVIDIKDASGRIFFDTDIALAHEIGSEDGRIPDLKEWLQELKEQGIYTIARIVVFQDPYLARSKPEISLKSKSGNIWRDYKGQAWVDPTYQLIWDYNLDLAKEAAAIGFDEINFDYIRFPSDGNISQIVYANLDKYPAETEKQSKNLVMADFYSYVGQQMTFVPALTSADLFGMTLWRSDGMNIGQRYEDAAQHFDYIAPMVYPSHYYPGFEGFNNPADHPYAVVYSSLIQEKDLVIPNKKAQLRPWLQDFDLGAVYDSTKIRAQTQAAEDAGTSGWFMWNARNVYTAGGFAVSDQ